MRFTPQSEEEAQKAASKFGPWPNGVYDFEVAEAEDKTSNAGNEMIVLTLNVFNEDGDRRTMYDYLLESISYKLRHAAAACGLLQQYERGEMTAIDFFGKTGRAKIGVQPARDNYPAKNVIRDYVPVKEQMASQHQAPARVKTPAGDLDDEIPF